MYYLGIDLGSSSIKLAVFDAENGCQIASVNAPDFEMDIEVPQPDWAEQNPEDWWRYTKQGLGSLRKKGVDLKKIKAIGIAYQMHGLVLTDEALTPLRPSIIWCDGRAVKTGEEQYKKIGAENCQQQILGSPGNFTAAKLKWVQENEPEIYDRARYLMLPGDYIAAKFSGVAQITASGLSEGTMWNFNKSEPAYDLLTQMGLDTDLIPEIVPNFGFQARIDQQVAEELGFNKETTLTYRSGDQPNNAFSLNVTQPGEIATTAGTSAVIYAITDKNSYDQKSRVNTFLNINNKPESPRNGVLLNINGSGILYRWVREILSHPNHEVSYEDLNQWASQAQPGSEGLKFYPFGNGPERIFNNRNVFSGIGGLRFHAHRKPELIRAASEGIVYALNYGFEIMKDIGVAGRVVRAGNSNLFQSQVFREIFVNTVGVSLELYNTSGAEGAARGAAVGDGFYTEKEAFDQLQIIEYIESDNQLTAAYKELYTEWKNNIKF